MKLGPTVTAAEVIGLCERLNPDHVPGRLTLITRMGADRARALPPLVAAVTGRRPSRRVGLRPHARQHLHARGAGYKTRHFDDVLSEIRGFFEVHRDRGTWPGGVHVELTGDDVTECLGGADEVLDEHLASRYETMCDPRLNARQSLDLAFEVAELLRN